MPPQPHNRKNINKPKLGKTIKFVGQGAYGCVFRPFVQCKGSNKPTSIQYISKIQKNTFDVQRESEYGKLINPLPLSKLFFAPIIDTCPVNISVIPQTEIKKCDVFTKSQVPTTEFISSKIRFAGKMEPTQYLLSISKNPKKVIRRLLAFHMHMLRALTLLHTLESPIIHNDIKNGNVIYDDKHGNPVIIDFGLSYQVKDITPENAASIFYTYEMYTPWCFDVTLLSYISRGIKTDINSTYITEQDITNIQGLLSEFMKKNELFRPDIQIISDKETSIFRQQYGVFITPFLNKTWKTLFDELVKNALTWDNYSVSTMFLVMIYDIFLSHNPDLIFRLQQTNSLSEDDKMVNWLKSYMQILKSNILIVPSSKNGTTRHSVSETKEQITTLTKSINKNEIMDFIRFIKKETITQQLQAYNTNNLKRKEIGETIRKQRNQLQLVRS